MSILVAESKIIGMGTWIAKQTLPPFRAYGPNKCYAYWKECGLQITSKHLSSLWRKRQKIGNRKFIFYIYTIYCSLF